MVTAERTDERGAIALDLQRRARRDALPEHTQYADTGCDVHPSCLTCPLVRCRYDEPGGVRKVFSEDRDRAMVGLQQEGVHVEVIARRFGVSRRTVFRALAKARTPPPTPSPLRQAQDAALAERGLRQRECAAARLTGLRRTP